MMICWSTSKPFQSEVVRQVVHNAAGWFQYKMQLEVMVKKQNRDIQKQNTILQKQAEQLNQVNELLIDSLSNIVEFRNLESKQHIKRVREYSMCLGGSVMKLFPEYGLTPEKLTQIVLPVDVYDALTSKRVYKMAYESDKAYQMILNGHSGTFSPKLLKAFAEVKPNFEQLLSGYRDED